MLGRMSFAAEHPIVCPASAAILRGGPAPVCLGRLVLRGLLAAAGCLGLTAGCALDASTPYEPRGVEPAADVGVVARSGPIGRGIDRRRKTPLTARGRCLDLIIACHSATDAGHDRCVQQLRRCQTTRPWDERAACCPGPCVDAYFRARRGGVDARRANVAAFDQRGCYPGVEAMIRGEL
jgi:hypothetical protein